MNSIESTISKALIDNEINHEDFMKTINEEGNYRELKKSIRMMKSQRSDIEKIKEELLIIENLKYQTMQSHYLKCKKNSENESK